MRARRWYACSSHGYDYSRRWISCSKRSSDCAWLAYDTTPGYIDTTPFPRAPTKWTYRGIYMVGDGPVGNWSAAKSIMVGS